MKHPIVYVKFWDHYQSDPTDARLLPCEVFGAVVKEDGQQIVVASWIADGDLQNHNNEVYCIAKSTIIQKRRLR